jgi:hypothetical protein
MLSEIFLLGFCIGVLLGLLAYACAVAIRLPVSTKAGADVQLGRVCLRVQRQWPPVVVWKMP